MNFRVGETERSVANISVVKMSESAAERMSGSVSLDAPRHTLLRAEELYHFPAPYANGVSEGLFVSFGGN